MRRRDLMVTGLGVTLAGAAAATAEPPEVGSTGTSLDPTLRPYLARFHLPAVAAAVVQGGRIVASGAVGTRRAGMDIPATIEDRFHIGSDTKAMTALLAAIFIEQGNLRWDSTVGGVFPELTATMDPGVKDITLEQLLSHTSGIPSDTEADWKLFRQSFTQELMNLDELRYWVIKQLVARPLQTKQGTRFAYSNMGYTLAGAMLERTGRKTWEELIAGYLFDAFGLKTAGFGPQATLGRVDAPLGHATLSDGTLKPMLAGPDGDNPVVLGPAGTVHLSVLDFAIWAGWNAGEGRRNPALVRPETVRKMHTSVIDMPPRPDAKPGTPSRGGYGLGWGTITMPFSSEPFVFHGGSNEMNLANVMLQPHKDFGMVIMTNRSGAEADHALMAMAEALYKEFGPAH